MNVCVCVACLVIFFLRQIAREQTREGLRKAGRSAKAFKSETKAAAKQARA